MSIEAIVRLLFEVPFYEYTACRMSPPGLRVQPSPAIDVTVLKPAGGEPTVSQTEIQPTAFADAQMDITGATRGTVLAVIAGELDISNSHILRVRLLAALRDQHPTVLNVDMTNVTFMDCSTVRALVSVHATAEKSGCRMRILNPRSIVVRILEVLGLLELFGTVPTPGDNVVRAGEVVTNDGQRAE